MTESKRIIIIGGGHNGLTCAAYLAKAGKAVTVLEAADQVGGAAITREFAEGFKVSAGAHLLNLLDFQVNKELGLSFHGLKLAEADLSTVSLAADGDHLVSNRQGASVGGFTAADQSALSDYRERMETYAGVIDSLYHQAPPRLAAETLGQIFALGKIGLRLKRLGKTRMREFMRIIGINIFDVLEENFDNDLLKGALSLDAVLGNQLGPRSNNSVLNALHRMSGNVGGQTAAMALPKGGMGAVSESLKAAAEAFGVVIQTGAEVASINMTDGRASSVTLTSGEEMAAAAIVSNADPKTTFLELLGARHLEAGFAARVNRIRCKGNAAKLHLALNGLPQFSGLDPSLVGERLLIAPEMTYVERAFDHCKYGRFSAEPALEISVPSVHDKTLTGEGQHVLSAIVQYAPYELKAGWDNEHESFQNLVIDLIAQYAPDIRSQIVSAELLTPKDIEKEFRISGGHWHHGELTLDQAFMLRPVPGAAHYDTPVDGLYLCGAGCHPGGGVMGSAGRNAAQRVVKAEESS
jgi:phytoene dehydrogenase-like protein